VDLDRDGTAVDAEQGGGGDGGEHERRSWRSEPERRAVRRPLEAYGGTIGRG
jgi:hypothetical protein